MICPEDLVQMHQYHNIGGGKTDDEIYRTWTLQVCPVCNRLVKEDYIAKVVESVEEAERDELQG